MIEADVVAALDATFNGRVFPLTAPHETARPFCLWQNVGGSPTNSLCGGSEKRNARIQITVHSDRALEAIQKMRAVRAIVESDPFLATSQGEMVTQYDEITRTYHAIQDWSFWFAD